MNNGSYRFKAETGKQVYTIYTGMCLQKASSLVLQYRALGNKKDRAEFVKSFPKAVPRQKRPQNHE